MSDVGTKLMLEALMKQLPEVNRRKRQSERATQSEQFFRELSQKPGNGNYTQRQQGGLFPTVQQYIPDYASYGNQIAGALGQLITGRAADKAALEHENMVGDESIKALQQIGGGEQDGPATAQSLRGYLGLIGGPVGKEMASKAPYVSSTKVDENGKVFMIMSDGTSVDTGRTADYNSRIMDDGSGNLLAVGTGGAGRGVGSAVVSGRPAGASPAAREDAALSNIPDDYTDPATGEQIKFGPDITQEVRRTLIGQPAQPATPPQPVRVMSDAEKEAAKISAKAQAEASAAGLLANTANQVKLAEEQAKGQAEAQAGLGKVRTTASKVVRAINELRNARGLKDIVGGSLWSRVPDRLAGYALPIVGAGGDSADALAKYQNLAGANFLQAFESLKGGGQITEKEGEKAELAFGRLQRSQSLREFNAALDDLEKVMQTLVTNAESRAAGGSRAPAAAPPAPGGFNLPAGWSVEVQ